MLEVKLARQVQTFLRIPVHARGNDASKAIKESESKSTYNVEYKSESLRAKETREEQRPLCSF